MKKDVTFTLALMLFLGMSVSNVSAYATENQNSRIISIAEFEEKCKKNVEGITSYMKYCNIIPVFKSHKLI